MCITTKTKPDIFMTEPYGYDILFCELNSSFSCLFITFYNHVRVTAVCLTTDISIRHHANVNVKAVVKVMSGFKVKCCYLAYVPLK
uniref:Uncharacterized protein n=1 Tax=Anguilla anguilla TaxID=7936 RepID=A0A0E9X8W0_ANGAN